MQGVQTFSVGVFEMVPTKDGKKLKRGPAKVRVHGSVGHYDLVIQKCHAIASLLDAGAYTEGKKTWV
jgi:hypothetical protein